MSMNFKVQIKTRSGWTVNREVGVQIPEFKSLPKQKFGLRFLYHMNPLAG